MAFIDRMSISGIRSFGHETSQKINFFSPVTLILGQNGTGKTTIIECLKYLTTGDLPPGSKTGCSFIHDPKLAQEVEVKAKVTLQLQDVKGCSMVVSRALVATLRDKAKQGTLKTLDGSIKRQSPDGTITSTSMRCSEVDQEMVTSLGVSKAVLENVIFCHQEESNWPLQEAKALKQRFDDLFASSRYVKALDAIRKCKLDNDGNIKSYKTELKYLTKNRDEASKIRSEREESLYSIAKEEENLKLINSKLDPVVESLNQYKQKYAELTQLQSDIGSCKSEYSHLSEMIANLAKNVTIEFEGTDEELFILVDNAESEFVKKEMKLKQFDSAVQNKSSKMKAFQNDLIGWTVERAQIEMEVKVFKENQTHRNQLILTALDSFNISDIPKTDENTFTSSDVIRVIAKLNELVSRRENELKQIKIQIAKEEEQAQSALDSTRDALASVKQKIDTTKQALEENKRERNQIDSRLRNEDAFSNNLKNMQLQLADASTEVDKLKEKNEMTLLRQTLSDLQTQKRECENSLNLVDERMSTYQENMNVHREFEVFKNERTAKLENIRKIRSRNLEALEQIFNILPIPLIATESVFDEPSFLEIIRQPRRYYTDSTRLKASFVQCSTQLEQNTKQSRQKLTKLDQELSGLQAGIKFTRSQLESKQSRLKQLEHQLLNAVGADDLEQTLNNLQLKRKQLEDDCANEQGSLYLWRKFRDRLAHSDSDCPVCHRGLASTYERDELLTELDRKISSMPSEFSNKKEELKQIAVRCDTLVELKPISNEFQQLKIHEIPEIETRLKAELEKLKHVQNQRDAEAALFETSQADENLAKSIQGDMAVLERFENEAFDLTVKLNQLKSKSDAAIFDSADSMETMQSERKSLRQTQLNLNESIERNQKNLEVLDVEQRRAIDKMHEMKDTVHKLEQENQENTRLKHTLANLVQTSSKLEAVLSDLECCQLGKVQTAWEETNAARTRLTNERDDKISTKQLDEVNRMLQKITEAHRNVDKHASAVQRFQTISQQLDSAKNELDELQKSLECDQSQFEALKKALVEHKIRQRELADHSQLRQLRAQLKQLTAKTESLNQNFQELVSSAGSGKSLIDETKRLSAEEESLRARKQDLSNLISELKAKLHYLDRDLGDKYGNAETEYRDMMYHLKVTEMACTDLERYYKALDRAIMSHHASKMAELNKIIRDLWRSTYRGNDIDYIEICSEEDGTSGSNVNRSRRTYNYRVVMIKVGQNTIGSKQRTHASNEARLDMRGRCSAGQKVLASLIIRLALAEVFCLHCGVLALDEPTTNLDRENIESLAQALVEIINNRQKQKNFQLIVITHDEDFVELLGRSDYVEDFYQLSRTPQGLSEIQRLPIDRHFR